MLASFQGWAHLQQRFHHFPVSYSGCRLYWKCAITWKNSPRIFLHSPRFRLRRFNAFKWKIRVRLASQPWTTASWWSLNFQKTVLPSPSFFLFPFITPCSPAQPFSSSARRREGECVGTHMRSRKVTKMNGKARSSTELGFELQPLIIVRFK